MPITTLDDLKRSIDNLAQSRKSNVVLARDRFVEKERPIDQVVEEVAKTNDLLKNMQIQSKKESIQRPIGGMFGIGDMLKKSLLPLLPLAGMAVPLLGAATAITEAVKQIEKLIKVLKGGDGLNVEAEVAISENRAKKQFAKVADDIVLNLKKKLDSGEITKKQYATSGIAAKERERLQSKKIALGAPSSSLINFLLKKADPERKHTVTKVFGAADRMFEMAINKITNDAIKKSKSKKIGKIDEKIKKLDALIESENVAYDKKNKVVKGSGVLKYAKTSKKIGSEFGIPPEILLGLIQRESAGGLLKEGPVITNSNSAHVGTFARGITQIMPKTQKGIEKRTGRVFDPMKDDEAIWAAGWLLNDASKRHKKRYNLDDADALKYAIVDYHSGPDGVKLYNDGKTAIDLATGLPTRQYVTDVLKYAKKFKGKLGNINKSSNSAISAIPDNIQAPIEKRKHLDNINELKKMNDSLKKLPNEIGKAINKNMKKQKPINMSVGTNSYSE